MADDQLYVLLGLRDEDERDKQAAREATRKGRSKKDKQQPTTDDIYGAAIPVSDHVVDEVFISYDKDHPTMKIGALYPSMDEFRLAVRQYAINEEFELGTEKSCKTKFRGFCKGDDCDWSIVGTRLNDNKTIKITCLLDDHNCTSTSRIKTITPSQAWVASKVVPILRGKPQMGAKELQTKLQDDYSVIIHYDTVWKGRERALKEIYGGWEESFQMLYNWKEEVLKSSPGSVVEIGIHEVEGKIYFHRFFCALKPCIEGFKEGCRPYLSIDSTALNGRWNGHLAAATGIDSHNWMYPVAFGFIGVENEDNWKWFMAHLRKAIGDTPLLAICTDACKGLANAVKAEFPYADRRECFWHLMQNFIKRWYGDSFGQMWPAARAYRYEEYEQHMASIFAAAPDVWPWLKEHHKLKWYRCGFNPDIKCDYITNNLAEVFNNWIKDIKDLPVVDLADKIREMIMVLWRKRRRIGERLHGNILSAVMVQLKANTRGLGHLKVISSANWSAEVWDSGIRHIVKLGNKECTCMEWQHTGKPCKHALAFLTTQRNIDLADFVHEYYSVEKFRAAYGRVIEPMTDKTQWPKVELQFVVGAPLGKRSVGRQKKLRIKGCLEGGGGKSKAVAKDGGKEGKKQMVRGPVTCQRCGAKGHRQSSYKCPMNGTKKRKRKPRKNTTKAILAVESTPKKTTMEAILQESPGMMTRRRLAMLMGEGTCSQPASSQTTAATPPKRATPKKMTPRKKKN